MAIVPGVVPTTGKQPTVPDPSHLQDEIDRLVKAGQLVEAEEKIRLILTIEPRADHYQSHAYILNKLNRHAETEEAVRQGLACAMVPDQLKAMLNFELAISFAQRNDMHRALYILDEASKFKNVTDEFRWEIYARKTAFLTHLRRFREAAAVATFTLHELHPISLKEKAKFLGMYANILNECTEYSTALLATLEALNIQAEIPDDIKADIYSVRARSHEKLGRPDDALIDLQLGLALPHISNTLYAHLTINICKIFIQSGQFQDVVISVEKVLTPRQAGVKPDTLARLYDYKSLALISLEQDQQGLEAANAGLSIQGTVDNTTKVKLSCQKAAALNNLNRYDEATQAIDACLALPHLENEYKVALFFPKAFALIRLNRTEEAVQLIQLGLRLSGVTPHTQRRLMSLIEPS